MVLYKDPVAIATQAQKNGEIRKTDKIMDAIDRGNGFIEVRTRAGKYRNPSMRYVYILKDGINISGHKGDKPVQSAWMKNGRTLKSNKIHFNGTGISRLGMIPQEMFAKLISIYGEGYRYMYHEYHGAWGTNDEDYPPHQEINLVINL